MPEFKNGTLLQERYRLAHQLGAGGASTVYLAFDEILNRQVAIKFLHQWTTHSGSANALRRFEREAQSLSQLLHPNIIRVFRFGVLENREAFLVMEYMSGETLRDLLHRKQRLCCNEAIDIAMQICAAFEYAHSAHTIHRDLKPENIMLSETPLDISVKVLDFGLCKFVPESGIDSEITISPALTETGLLIGTAAYMSPEQGMGEAVDYRSDIYSFGCVLFEMITGAPPFSGEAPGQILLKHLSEPVPRIVDTSTVSGLPQALEDLILKCTAKNKNERYQSFVDLGRDLLVIAKLNSVAVYNPGSAKVKGKERLLALAGIVLALILSVSYASKHMTGALLKDALKHQDIEALAAMIEKRLSEKQIQDASALASEATRSGDFTGWTADQKTALLDRCFDMFKQAGQEKDTLVIANRLFYELIQQGAELEQKAKRPNATWEQRLCKVGGYLLAHEVSREAWHQISFQLETARGKRNRGLERFLSNQAKLIFLEVRGEASIRQSGKPGSAELGRAVDIYLLAADRAWNSEKIADYQKYMKKAEACGVLQLKVATDFHSYRAREYLASGLLVKAAGELALSRNLFEDDSRPCSTLQIALEKKLAALKTRTD